MSSPPSTPHSADMIAWADAINRVLKRFSDKDWNYSRIFLETRPVQELSSPYVLGVEWLDVRNQQSEGDYKNSLQEIIWGERHSHELGMLEIASLRLNRALAEVTTADFWHGVRPVIRLQKRSDLLEKGQSLAFWYRIEEVQGEEFENR